VQPGAMMRTMRTTRLIAVEDARALADLLQLNREFLAQWDPIRPEDYFTAEGQCRVIEEALEAYNQKIGVPHVILERGRTVGRVTLQRTSRFERADGQAVRRYTSAASDPPLDGSAIDLPPHSYTAPSTSSRCPMGCASATRTGVSGFGARI
jgi:hypothetical protein